MFPAQVWCYYAGDGGNAQPVQEGHPGNFPPDPARFNAPINDHHQKPFGGLWTSSYTPRRLCNWTDWAGASMGTDWVKAWVLIPEQNPRLWNIDSVADMQRLLEQYPWSCSCSLCQSIDAFTDGMYSGPMSLTMRHPYDVEAMAADGWDGIHLSLRGQSETRFPALEGGARMDFWQAQVLSLYGWDCECTFWLRWAFLEVRYFGYWHWTDPFPDVIAQLRRELAEGGQMTPELEKALAELVAEHEE